MLTRAHCSSNPHLLRRSCSGVTLPSIKKQDNIHSSPFKSNNLLTPPPKNNNGEEIAGAVSTAMRKNAQDYSSSPRLLSQQDKRNLKEGKESKSFYKRRKKQLPGLKLGAVGARCMSRKNTKSLGSASSVPELGAWSYEDARKELHEKENDFYKELDELENVIRESDSFDDLRGKIERYPVNAFHKDMINVHDRGLGAPRGYGQVESSVLLS